MYNKNLFPARTKNWNNSTTGKSFLQPTWSVGRFLQPTRSECIRLPGGTRQGAASTTRINLVEPVRVASPTRINLEEPIRVASTTRINSILRLSVRQSFCPWVRAKRGIEYKSVNQKEKEISVLVFVLIDLIQIEYWHRFMYKLMLWFVSHVQFYTKLYVSNLYVADMLKLN